MTIRFGTKLIETKEKMNVCENCERLIGQGISKTALHHIFYDVANPEKYTVELCYRCYSQYHNLKGELGDTLRKKIKDMAIQNWGLLDESVVLFEDREAAHRQRTKLYSSGYTSGEKALSKNEFEKLISVIDNIEDELLIKMAVTTGLRREDLCDVKINNINFEDGLLSFYESKKKIDRSIYLNLDVILLIKKFLKTQDRRDTLFSFSGRTAYRHLNHWCKIAGIPERPFHALRATCIKFCQVVGWKPEQVCKLTGDTLRTIQEHYATPSESEMKEAVRDKPIL